MGRPRKGSVSLAKVEHKDNPKLMIRTCNDGSKVYYLEYYRGRLQEQRLDAEGKPMYYTSGKMAGKPMYYVKHIRTKETLPWHIRPDMTKEQKTAIARLAEKIRQERELEFLKNKTGYIPDFKQQTNFVQWCEDLIANTQADKKVLNSTLGRFKGYLQEAHPEHYGKDKGIDGQDVYLLNCNDLTKELAQGFFEHLKGISEGNGAACSFRRFKRLCKRAVEDGVMKSNPCDAIAVKTTDELTKDILSAEEISQLTGTHYKGENPEIRKAFIFSLYTGCRFCDVVEMRYSNIDFQNKTLSFQQQKVKESSSHSQVTIPILETLLEMIGTAEANGKARTDKIFKLPSSTMCLKALRTWTKKAGIEKHITWHCARHSFATLLAGNNVNEAVIAKMLGHSSVKMTEKYTDATNKAKQDAMKGIGLPEITE